MKGARNNCGGPKKGLELREQAAVWGNETHAPIEKLWVKN